MKTQIIMTAAALLISAVVTAQTTERTQTQKREKDKARTEVQNQPQGPVQVQDQEQYKNRGEAVSNQRHARNAERKALKDQEKAMKRQQKELKGQQNAIDNQGGTRASHRNMEMEQGADQNHGARPAATQQKTIKVSKGYGKGRK